MKKRSLVAALAMLMVSAIVLTSSTYAWFATSNKAQVTGVQASVENADGSILISATGDEGTFATSVNYADFKDKTGNVTPDAFTPVSYNPAGDTWIRGSISQGENADDTATYGKLVFKPQIANGGEYIKIKVYMKATAACTVNVSGTMNSAYNFIYAAIHDDSTASNYKVFANGERSYTPVISATEGIDKNADSIMTADDTNTDGSTSYTGLAGAPVNAKATGNDLSVTFTAEEATAGTVKTVTVYVWAEGNDPACAGSLKSETCGVTLNFSK